MAEEKGDNTQFWLTQAKIAATSGDYEGTIECVKRGRRHYKRSLREILFGCEYWRSGDEEIKYAYRQAVFNSLENAKFYLGQREFGWYKVAISNANFLAGKCGLSIKDDLLRLEEEVESLAET